MVNYFPKYFTDKAIQLYIFSLLAISLIFYRYTMQWYIFEFGILEVAGFFYFSNVTTRKWSRLSSKAFVNKIFVTSLVIRLVWVVFGYFFFIFVNGQPFEFDAADSINYHYLGSQVAERGFSAYDSIFKGMDIADTGYATYLGFIYMIFGKVIIIPRLLKAFYGAWTVVLIYKVANRNFGEETARISSVLAMLMPNLILYSGLHLKEVEMVLMSVAFIERTDLLIRARKFNFANVFPPLIISMAMFTFRTALGLTALFALITAVLFSSQKILGFAQRIFIAIWVVFTVMYFIGGKIATEAEQMWKKRETNQSGAIEYRSKMAGANKYVKYGTSAVFAPAIFIIPVPTMVNVETQMNMQFINGGNYDKEILAFFVILALIWIIKNKKWRDFTLIGVFMLGYLLVIAMSAFGGSERFHQPALPFVLMFAAYGITKVNKKTKKQYLIYLVLLFVVLVGWNWMKLNGRGLI